MQYVWRAAFAFAMLLVGSATLSADIIITPVNDPTFENVLFVAPGLELGPAATVQGETQSGVRVDFISGGAQNLVVVGERVEAEGGGTFNDVTIQAQINQVFTKLIFNLNVSANGTVTFNTAPGSVSGDPTFAVNGGGENFFTLEATNNQTLASVTLNLAGGAELQDIRQVRTGAVIPEPASVLTMTTGVIALLFLRKRRKA
jgi:hypothetical protein